MAARPRVSFATGGGGRATVQSAPVVETSSTRRRIQDVLGQARAALRQSQQFRHIPADKKDNNLSNKLQFQQQPQDDYWSSPGAGNVMSATTAKKEKNERSGQNYDNEDSKSIDGYHQTPQKDDFGTPFRDAMRKSSVASAYPKTPSLHKKMSVVTSSTTEQNFSDASTTSISMSTNDLKVSPGSEELSSSEDSQLEGDSQHESAKRSIKSATTKSSKREMKLKEWEVPSTVKLTPLNSAVTSVPVEAFGDIGPPEVNVESGDLDDEDEINSVPLPRRPMPSAVGKVEMDDMGFSRAHITRNDEDPHWFEKALLARGETISEAAYKAFKQAQSVQLQQQAEEAINKSLEIAVKKTKGKPIFSNLTDPEYTADWISDAGLNSLASEVDMPVSEYNNKEEDIEMSKEEVELDLVEDDDGDDINTASMIRTATELEQSGMLDEITENLQSVLDISDHPESQNFSGMSAEEKTFAKEYDEAMMDADEPLQSIFVDEVQGNNSSGSGNSRENRNESQSFSGTVGQGESTSGQRRKTLSNNADEEDDYDDNTFIQMDSTVSSFTKSMSKRQSNSKSAQQTSSTLMSGKNKKSTSATANTTSSSTVKSSKSVKAKVGTSSSGGGGSGTASDKSKAKSINKTKSYASTSSTTSKRLNSLPIPPDPPTSRHQKIIQNVLEKEVYQKELRRIRSEKLREERKQEKLQKIAQEALERNKKTTWKDPQYTEILLPELFKYKSVSGLQAAKAKRSILTPPMNYGAPYFQMNGAISATEGTEAILAAAKVESLDIPDLVREVLASNERMYRMTVEASEQMAKRAYKDKVRKEMKRNATRK